MKAYGFNNEGKTVADAIYEELQPMTSLNLTLGIIKYKGSDAGGYLSGFPRQPSA